MHKGKASCSLNASLPHPLGQQIRTDEIACNRIPTPQTRYLQCMQTKIPTLDMKLIITNRTSSFPVISLLYFCSFFVFGGSEYGINHRIISSLENTTPQAALLCMYKLNSITNNMITFQLNKCIQPIPHVASSTPDLMHNYINKTQKNIMEITACRYPSRWQSLPHLCVVVFSLPYSQAILNPFKLTSYYLHPLRFVAPVVPPSFSF